LAWKIEKQQLLTLSIAGTASPKHKREKRKREQGATPLQRKYCLSWRWGTLLWHDGKKGEKNLKGVVTLQEQFQQGQTMDRLGPT